MNRKLNCNRSSAPDNGQQQQLPGSSVITGRSQRFGCRGEHILFDPITELKQSTAFSPQFGTRFDKDRDDVSYTAA